MILVTEGKDQLRWGNNSKGTFNLKEAKYILLGLESCILEKSWRQLWSHQGWMKIKLFMWLVHHKKILAWDNIRKGVSWGLLNVSFVKSKRRLWSTSSTAAPTPTHCGIPYITYSYNQTGTKRVSLTP